MPEAPLKHVSVEDVDGIAVVGFVDADILYASAVVQEIGEELRSLVSTHGYTKILLDFKNVQYISSTMLAYLARLQKDVDAVRGNLKIVGLGPTLKDIFRIGNFDRIFSIHDDAGSALKSFH